MKKHCPATRPKANFRNARFAQFCCRCFMGQSAQGQTIQGHHDGGLCCTPAPQMATGLAQGGQQLMAAAKLPQRPLKREIHTDVCLCQATRIAMKPHTRHTTKLVPRHLDSCMCALHCFFAPKNIFLDGASPSPGKNIPGKGESNPYS